jgi:hypothetical protein
MQHQNDMHRVDLLLNLVEENCAPEEYQRSRIPFMIDCLLLVEQRMPLAAAQPFLVSRLYADQKVDSASLVEAIEKSWRALGRGEASLNLGDPDVSAVRAVICILHSELHPESNDFVDSISFFLNLLNNVKPCSEQQEALIKKHFPTCFADR